MVDENDKKDDIDEEEPEIINTGSLSNEDLDKIGLIYEYLDQAGPMAINSFPMFMSMRILHADDFDQVREIILALKKAEDSALEEGG